MKKILITGAGGFISTEMIRQWQNQYDITAIGRHHLDKNLRARFIKHDLSSEIIMDDNFDVIIHTAARSPSIEASVNDYYQDNIKATEVVLDFANKTKSKRLIYLGAVSSYGTVDGVLKENTPLYEPEVYGITKYMAERMVLDSSIPTTVLVLPGVVGKNCRDSWIVDTARKLFLGDELRYYNPEGLFNNIVHVEDICKFSKKIIEGDVFSNEKYLLASLEKMRVEDVINYIAETFQSKSAIKVLDENKPAFWIDASKAFDMGFYPRPLCIILGELCEEIKQRLG